MEEICLCHGEVWKDRIDLLEHQVQFYMRRTEKNRKEAEIFRAALARKGGKPEELLVEQEQLRREERRLKIYEQKLDEEKRNVEECIIQERNYMQERAMAMAAWEQHLEQRSRELAIRTRQYTPES